MSEDIGFYMPTSFDWHPNYKTQHGDELAHVSGGVTDGVFIIGVAGADDCEITAKSKNTENGIKFMMDIIEAGDITPESFIHLCKKWGFEVTYGG